MTEPAARPAAAGAAALPSARAGTGGQTARSAVGGVSDIPGVRFLPAPPVQIVPATDLGSVVTLKHGNGYLLTDQFGDIHPDSRGLGLYHEDTRILSHGVLRINGLRPALLQASAGGNYRGAVHLTNPDYLRHPGLDGEPPVALARQSIGIQRDRILGGGALLEQLRLVNYTAHEQSLDIELDLGVDHADIFEVRGYPRAARGEVLPIALTEAGDRMTFRYVGRDGWEQSTHLAFSEAGAAESAGPSPVGAGPAAVAPGGAGAPAAAALTGAVVVRWSWSLPAGATRHLEWRVWSTERRVAGAAGVPGGRATAGAEVGGAAGASPGSSVGSSVGSSDVRAAGRRRSSGATFGDLFPPPPQVSADQGATAYRAWTASTTGVDTDNRLFDLAIQRSVADLRLLLNDGPGPDERYVAAGVPWFTTLFGRDAIITALQLLAFRPQLAVETLAVLAARQATTVDDWRDAEPGKILHELRNSEMVRAGELPFSPYYGTVDATPLWLVLLGATYDWTGDRGLIDRYWPNVLAALEWIDRWGDIDGDGFVEYGRRSSGGLENQGWKDSPDSVRDRHGQEAAPPIALAEVQGYVFDAKIRVADLAMVRGDRDLAARLRREAEALRVAFESSFWVEDQGFYAVALDGAKRPADAIASNAGHCLWSGIVAPARARAVCDRLLGPTMFSGWGIRTYAAGQPGFNPIGYHTGSVWPHDTSIAAAGLKRYGLHDEANRLVGAIFEAGQHFSDNRLPELFCGFDRGVTGTPVPYPVACSPQAWAAGSAFQFLQTMLGLAAHADRRELELLRPQLPTWLSRVTLTNVRVGDAAVDLLFHRWRGTTSAEVLRKVGDVSVTIRL